MAGEPVRPVAARAVTQDGRVTEQVWPLPLEEAFLERLFRDLFENHWEGLIFGPLTQGGAYELRCPRAPDSVTVRDGYLTVHWGTGGHFHLCIGANHGPESNPTPVELMAHRRPSRVEFFRGLDRSGDPVTWGLRMLNGKGEQQITLFFPNPFLTDADGIAETPDFTRLALWTLMMETYAGWTPDGRDTAGKGFGKS